jgi:simple sugar transport system permease protein
LAAAGAVDAERATRTIGRGLGGSSVIVASGILLSAFAEGTIRTATPLILAASGELLIERAGLINIGLEGVLLAGAFGATAGATYAAGGWIVALSAAALAGVLLMLVFAGATLGMGADQIITGTALTLLALGITGTLYRSLFGATGSLLTIGASRNVVIPFLSELPFFGRALFAQPMITYLTFGLVPLEWWFFARTHLGLAVRAIGENPAAAVASGVPVRRVQLVVCVVAGALGGIAGGVLVAQAGTFVEGMSAGRGFIAIAIVVLGRWRPVGVALASLLFAATTSLQYLTQAMGLDIPYQVVLALPYTLTLAALAGIGGRAIPPAMLARVE